MTCVVEAHLCSSILWLSVFPTVCFYLAVEKIKKTGKPCLRYVSHSFLTSVTLFVLQWTGDSATKAADVISFQMRGFSQRGTCAGIQLYHIHKSFFRAFCFLDPERHTCPSFFFFPQCPPIFRLFSAVLTFNC